MIQIDVIIIVRFGVMRVIGFIVDVIGGAGAAATVVCVIVAAIAVFAIQFGVVAFDDNAGDMMVLMVIIGGTANRCRYGRWCDRHNNFLGFDAGNQRLLMLLMTFIATKYGQFH